MSVTTASAVRAVPPLRPSAHASDATASNPTVTEPSTASLCSACVELRVELLGRYQNQTDVRDRSTHLLSLPSMEERYPEEHSPRQRQRRLRAPDQEELIARYRSGESVYALAEAFDITRQTVSQVLDRHDVPRRYRLLGESDISEAHELYKQGLSLSDVGERVGASARTVRNAFGKAGFETRPVGTNQWR